MAIKKRFTICENTLKNRFYILFCAPQARKKKKRDCAEGAIA